MHTVLTIIAVTYNSRPEIELFLDSLAPSLPKHMLDSVEVRISDNASTDGTQQFLRDYAIKSPLRITLTLNPRNLGLSKATNNEIEHSGGSYLLFCNPDITFTPKLLLLLEEAQKLPHAYGLVPELCYPDGRPQHVIYRRFPNLLRIFSATTFTASFLGRIRGLSWVRDDYCYRNRLFKHLDVVEQPGGVCLLMHRDAVEFLNPFYDEAFPITWNDVDMALRAWNVGIRFLIVPEVVFAHVIGHSFNKLGWDQRLMIFVSHSGLMGFASRWKMHPHIIQFGFFIDTVVASAFRLALLVRLLKTKTFHRSKSLAVEPNYWLLRFRATFQ